MKLSGLVKQIHNRSDKLKRVTDELDCVIPEPDAVQTTKINTKTSDVVTTTTETFSICIREASEYAQSAWIWVSNFSDGLFSTKTEPKTTKPGKTEISLASIIGH